MALSAKGAFEVKVTRSRGVAARREHWFGLSESCTAQGGDVLGASRDAFISPRISMKGESIVPAVLPGQSAFELAEINLLQQSLASRWYCLDRSPLLTKLLMHGCSIEKCLCLGDSLGVNLIIALPVSVTRST